LVLLYYLVVMILPAQLVLFDSPTRVDAFWRSQPASPLALGLAKLLFTVPIVPLVMVIQQTLSIRSMGLVLGASLHSVTTVAYVGSSLVLLAALVACVVPDLRTFIYAFFGFLILRGAFYSKYMLGAWLTAIASSTPGLRADVWLGLAAALLLWAYVSLVRRKRTKQLVLVASIALLTLAWDSGDLAGIRFFGPTNEVANAALPDVRINAQLVEAGVRVQLTTRAPAPGSRFIFIHTDPVVDLPDASRILEGHNDLNFAPEFASQRYSSAPANVVLSWTIMLDRETMARLRQQSVPLLLHGFLVEQQDTLLSEFAAHLDSGTTMGADRLIVRNVSYDTLPQIVGVEQLHIDRRPTFATIERQYRRYPKNLDWSTGIRYTLKLPDSEFEYLGAYNAMRDTLRLGSRRQGGSNLPLAHGTSNESRPYLWIAQRDPGDRILRVPDWLNPDTRILVHQWRYKSYKPVNAVLILPRTLPTKN
ncbi:MAG: hypothetical protein ABI852_17480, partial [Gemmatimonadaceae bacterium]